jgi:RimJ/RimL family protein N-acetyltransferase
MKTFVETDRFILREMVPTDLDGLFALDSDPEVHRYLGNQPVNDKNKLIEIIRFIRKQYVDNGIGRWAIIDKKTNDFIGWSGLKFVTEEINNHKNYYDLGYRIRQKYWGQGFGTETAIASLNYAFHTLQIPAVYAAASIDNVASNRILQKVGFHFIETFYYTDIECNWYRIDQKNFQSIQTEEK